MDPLSASGWPAPIKFGPGAATSLVVVKEEPIAAMESVCENLPWLRLTKQVSANLGGHGPDKHAEEGIIFKAIGFNMGLDGWKDNLEVHIHVVNRYHRKTAYEAPWPKENGLFGHFARVNLHSGSNVTLRVHAYDATTKEDLNMEHFAMTFFDLDMGAHKDSVEYIHMSDFDHFFLTNSTEVYTSMLEDGSYLFSATKEGSGSDNPEHVLKLTTLQKNRVVSFMYSNKKEVLFEFGASPGKSVRVFNFALRPVLRCARTCMPDGNQCLNNHHTLPANAPDSPVKILKGSAGGAGPAIAVTAAALALLFLS